jgi:Bacterial Ig domain
MNPRMILPTTLLCLTLTACPGSSGTDFTVGLLSPAGTAYTNGLLNVQATVTGGTAESLELLRNGTSLATLNAPYSYTWDTSALSEGGYSLSVRASKGGQIFQGEARTVFVDRTTPTVSLTGSTAAITAAGGLDLAAEASDSRGVARVEFFDGAAKLGEATSSPYTLNLNLGSSDNREHTYSAKATDRAGNSATSAALKVNVLIPKRISENLIINGDAEAGPASATGDFVTDLPGWPKPVSNNRFTVVPYGASTNFPSQAQAPANAGNNFFAGGPNSSFSGSIQTITLPSDWFAAIDAGTVNFELSGFFGGFGSEGDNSKLLVSFLDTGNFTVLTKSLGPVNAVDRGSTTGFLQRTLTEAMPKLTRSIHVSLEMNRTSFIYNDGYADNLSLVLNAY